MKKNIIFVSENKIFENGNRDLFARHNSIQKYSFVKKKNKPSSVVVNKSSWVK